MSTPTTSTLSASASATTEIFDLNAVGLDNMLSSWYQFILLGMLGASGTGAIVFTVWLLIRIVSKNPERTKSTVASPDTKQYLQQLSPNTAPFQKSKVPGKPRTFGVYYGSVGTPPSEDEARVLQQWELIIVNPFQPGVTNALLHIRPKYAVGRVDIGPLLHNRGNLDRVSKVKAITDFVFKYMKPVNGICAYNGIMIANWEQFITPEICNELIVFFSGLKLNVFAEIAAPKYTVPATAELSGMVFVNGSVMSSGERRDYFELLPMRKALDSATSQACLREFTILMCDIVEDEAVLANAVLRRSFTWCGYYGAIPWVGKRSSLTDASRNFVVDSPDSAFAFLKKDRVVDVHTTWRLNSTISNTPVSDKTVYSSLEPLLPGISEALDLHYVTNADEYEQIVDVQHFNWVSKVVYRTVDPLSTSSHGFDYSGLGCFPIGMHVTQSDFDTTLRSQTRLLKLNLLQKVDRAELKTIGLRIQMLLDSTDTCSLSPNDISIIRSLVEALTTETSPEKPEAIEVYLSLDTGFRTEVDGKLWGVYDGDGDCTRLFITRTAKDLAGTILHTYLSSHRCVRGRCFEAELALAKCHGEINEDNLLPPRQIQDLDMLTPAEMLSFLQALAISADYTGLLGDIRQCCEYRLIQISTATQLRNSNSAKILRGEISAEELITERIQWYKQNKVARLPSLKSVVHFFNSVHQVIGTSLRYKRKEHINSLVQGLENVIKPGKIDVRADLFALAVFCSFRRLAVEEIYLDVTDRCPLFNDQPDQAAIFAELFGLGSRCQAFFDVSPNVLGKILYEKYRTTYANNQPPLEADDGTTLATSYVSANPDLDREGITDPKKNLMSKLQHTSYIGVFAVPALIDILLLTLTGRGLYLSGFMEPYAQEMATNALIVSLILCGAVSSWIGMGGSYYLWARVYPTMNIFMITRMIGGIVLVSILAFIGFVTFGAVRGVQKGAGEGMLSAAFFAFYLFALTFYFFILAVLSNMQFPGTPLPSGRTAVGQSLLLLTLSPVIAKIVSLYTSPQDTIIYPCVLFAFCILLLLRARQVIGKWNTWLLEIPTNTDSEVLDWYRKQHGDKCYDGLTGPAAMQRARAGLHAAVMKERAKPFWANPTSDENVRKLAGAYPTTLFILDWYSGCVGSKLKPLPYSSTWNLQINVAVAALRTSDKGLRLHNAFVHWRFANIEIACGVMYFILALLDRWIELFCKGELVGLLILGESGSRIAIGFSLVYYLFAAFILDFYAVPLYTNINKGCDEKIRSSTHLNEVAQEDARIKRRLYWGTLCKFYGLQLWGLAFCSAMIWTFVKSQEATILFVAYSFSYTGLLWFQYNKIFALSDSVLPLFIAIVVGFSFGLPLRLLGTDYYWKDVLALGVATWTAGTLTFRAVELAAPKFEEFEDNNQKFTKSRHIVAHSQKAIGPHSDISGSTLSDIFDELERLPKSEILAIKTPGAIASEVLQILTSAKHAPKALEIKAAFPHAFDLLNHIIVGWDTGEVTVFGVSMEHMVGPKRDICAVSRKVDRRLKIYIGMELQGRDWMSNLTSNAHTIAEAIVHETCEVGLGLSHSDAVLAELLVASTEELRLPLRMQRQLEMSSSPELLEILNRRDEELVRHLGLQTDFDREWDSLPNDVRKMLVKRVSGETYEINETQLKWIESKCGNRTPYHVYLARRDLNTCLDLLVDDFAAALIRDPAQKDVPTRREPLNDIVVDAENEVTPRRGKIRAVARRGLRILRNLAKFFVIALVADPEYQRELAFLLTGNPLRKVFVFFLTRLWIYARFVQQLLLPLFIFPGRPHVQRLANVMKAGTVATMENNRLLIDNLKSRTTAFIEVQRDGAIKLWQYSGNHAKKPDSDAQLISINLYSKSLAITRRQEFSKGQMINDFVYEYASNPEGKRKLKRPRRTPTARYCVAGNLEGEVVQYSRKGFIKSGTAIRNGTPYEFSYDYRRKAKFDDELLRVKYTFNPRTLSPLTVHVWWCVPPVRHVEESDRWIPFAKVTHAQFVQNGDVYETKWSYDHKCHPTLTTLLNGEEAKTPDMILHDHLAVLSKPGSTSFVDEDPLLPFDSIRAGFFARLLRLNRKTIPVATSRSRAFLWKSWKDGTQFDGVTARWLDELALRQDRVLKPYWKARDSGDIHNAIKYLRANGDAIMASVDMDSDISAWTSLAFKMSDFFSMGQGGDTSINTRTATNQINDSHEQLHVMGMDTGTFPNEGGGVSCCRRDLVNNLQYIKWHIVAETANDYGVPRFQIEQNIQSLKLLPLWGLDFLTPTHGVIENQLDTAMDAKLIDTSNADIREKFLPILTSLVRGARTIKYTPANVEEFTRALVRLNTYFQTRNWGVVWKSKAVKNKWRELWLSKSMENTRPIQEWFSLERPSIADLDTALDLYSRYLFIFSLPVPEQLPTVFQATHHSIGAAYGIVCKIKRHCTFQIWDHAISWRETNMYLSAAQCSFPPFVRIALIGLMRLACHLNYHHADVILPCTNYFNPGWEVELGSCEGTLVHRKKFFRKVDPVVNGICNLGNFSTVKEITTQIPTVTMLSHVQYTKDPKTALLAADVIVNKWGFKDYKLDIYGSLDRTPSYTVECQEIIAAKSLRQFVALKGYGNAAKVFAETWVFMNSSVSEGLPLAIGEAALCGAPIVCTDVGATFQVVSDPDNPKKRFGAVVPPNDPEALARAQIAMLAVMDEWAEYGEDDVPPPPLPEVFTPKDVEWITKRMYEKRSQRQKVGSQLRHIVERSFSGDRYLREHEQMLWLGKHRNEAKRERLAAENKELVLNMLDDMYTGIEPREYRPEFLRHVSGFSAFNSSTSELNRSTLSVRTTSFLIDDAYSRKSVAVRHPYDKALLSPTRAWLMGTRSSSDASSEGTGKRLANSTSFDYESESEGVPSVE